MPTKTDTNKSGGNDNRRIRLNLADLGKDEEKPSIIVTALDENLRPIHTTEVDNSGNFTIPQRILDKAQRVTVGPKIGEGEKADAESILTFRAAQFTDLIKNGALDIAKINWNKWRLFLKCVTGRVRHCRRSPLWYLNLHRAAIKAKFNVGRNINAPIPSVSISKFASLNRVSPSLSELLNPRSACEMICIGTVEVYRRTCCCQPWIINDLRLPELIRDLENIVRRIPDVPPIPNPPIPPLEIERAFFKDGTLDETAVNASADLAAIRTLPKAEIAAYVNARPHLICRGFSCSRPVKVATGFINPNGRFNICWSEFPTILRPFCHREYAFIVKQEILGVTNTIYNGITGNQWYDRAEDVVLKSYSRKAMSCFDNGSPGTGAFVFLQAIGTTPSSKLITPDATGWDRAAIPPITPDNPEDNWGLVNPGINCNWGGVLKLFYTFSEDMRTLGAKYYRISIAEADNNGNPNPATNRWYLSNALSWQKYAPGVPGGFQSETLGPFSFGGNDNLYKIPYTADAVWFTDQFHGYLDTNDARWDNPNVEAQDPNNPNDPDNLDYPDKRHLVTVEVFDSTGARLRPTGTPATGLPGAEKQANFNYRRLSPVLEKNVPFAALTHLFWWDNSPVIASIDYLTKNGGESLGECQFLVGTERIGGNGVDSTFGIGYRAFHPKQRFQNFHSISWKRGLGNVIGFLEKSKTTNVGRNGVAEKSNTNTFHVMLHTDPSKELPPPAPPQPVTHELRKCAFTVFLDIYAKTTDGDTLSVEAHDTGAFALEIESPKPS